MRNSKTLILFESIQKNLNEDTKIENNINKYKDSKLFNADQIEKIERGFEEGLTPEQIDIYGKPEFNYAQMWEILSGFIDGLSIEQVSVYAKPEFNNHEMSTIERGLHYYNLTPEQIELVANPKFKDIPNGAPSYWQMEVVLLGFEHGLSTEQVSIYAKPEFDYTQMEEIERGFAHGLTMEQVQTYAKPEFDSKQMHQIRKGL